MNYPDHTITKPLAGREAKRLLAALRSGGHLANPQAIATIHRIAQRRGKLFTGHEPLPPLP